MAMEILRSNAPQFMLKSERDVEAKFTSEFNERLWPRIPQPPRKDLPIFLPEGYQQAGVPRTTCGSSPLPSGKCADEVIRTVSARDRRPRERSWGSLWTAGSFGSRVWMSTSESARPRC